MKSSKEEGISILRPRRHRGTAGVISGLTIRKGHVGHRKAGAEKEYRPFVLLQSKEDTATTVMSIEDTLSRGRFSQEQKLPRLAEIMQQHFDFQALYQGLGLAK